jgi:hypothetical protein
MRIDALPMWAVFAGTIVVVMVAIEAGYLLGQAMHRRSDEEKESPVSAIAGAILGLAAFMLAFTFGIVSERYDAKRALVREDAVALRTAWQRSDFLPEPDRAEAKTLLRQYVDLRVQYAEEGTLDPEHVQRFLSETQRIQDQLWTMAVANARQDMNSDVAAMAGFAWRRWQPSRGPRGCVHVDWVEGFTWMEWQLSHGLGGRHPWNMQ